MRGQLTDEMLATETLAMLLQREGRIEEALEECVRAGRNDTAEKIASKLPERNVRIEHIVPSRVAASQATYFTVAAAAADHLPDADTQRLAESALALLDGSGPPLAQQLGPSPRLTALHFLATASDALTTQQRQRLIEHVRPLVGGPEAHPRNTDEDAMTILAAAVSASDDDTLVPLLARAIMANAGNAERLVGAVRLSTGQPDALEQQLAPAALDHRHVARTLIVAGRVPATVIAQAEAAVSVALAPPSSDLSTVVEYSGGPDAGVFGRVLPPATRLQLAETLTARALDESQSPWTRHHDLGGVYNIARYLDAASKARIRPAVLHLARSASLGEHIDVFFHPMDLSCRALEIATLLGPNDEEAAQLERLALSYIRNTTPSQQWLLASSLDRIAADGSCIEAAFCAHHPTAALRSLAVRRWKVDPTVLSSEEMLTLAADEHPGVRRTVARALIGVTEEADPELRQELRALLAKDPRRTVRRIVN
nr:hypothetical protein GCM10020063_010060 [Dactylosporangium thailandense]